MSNTLWVGLYGSGKVTKVVDGDISIAIPDKSTGACCTDIFGDLWIVINTNLNHYISGVLVDSITLPSSYSKKVAFGIYSPGSTDYCIGITDPILDYVTFIGLTVVGSRMVRKPELDVSRSLIGTYPIRPYGITVDSLGNWYVANNGNNNVTRIDNNGMTPATSMFTVSLGAGAHAPYDICADSLNGVWVSCTGTMCVKKIANASAILNANSLAITGLQPMQIVADTLGNVYVRCSNGQTALIKKYAGAALVFTTAAFGTNETQYPAGNDGMCCDPLGNVYCGSGRYVSYYSCGTTMLPAGGVAASIVYAGKYGGIPSSEFGACIDTVRGLIYLSTTDGCTGYPITCAVLQVTIGTATTYPYSICSSKKDGSIYLSCYGLATVFHITDNGPLAPPTVTAIVTTGGVNNTKILCDNDGYIWVLSYSAAKIFQIDGDTVINIFNVGAAYDMCIDDWGDMWITHISTGTFVRRLNADKTAMRTTLTMLANSWGICSDGCGNLFSTSAGSSKVNMISNLDAALPITPTITQLIVPAQPYYPFADSAGYVYIPCYTTANCIVANFAGVIGPIATGLQPFSGCCDASDNIWVACAGTTMLYKYTPAPNWTAENSIGVGIVGCAPKCVCCVDTSQKQNDQITGGGL